MERSNRRRSSENREAYAAKFNYDLLVTYEDLKKAEKKSRRKKVSFKPKKPVKMELGVKTPGDDGVSTFKHLPSPSR